MLVIDQLRLSLPSGFEHRAANVARLVADELAISGVAGGHIHRLEVPAIQVDAGTGDRHIAGQVASAIHQQLQGVRS